jgi:hypothetical protein
VNADIAHRGADMCRAAIGLPVRHTLPVENPDPHASPRGLVPDSRSPLRRGRGAQPERVPVLAAGVRAEMERGLAGLRDNHAEGSET